MSLVIPLPAAPPPANAGPPRSGGRSAPPDGDPFASVLDQQARTATAEGLAKQQDAIDANAPGGRGRASAGDPAQPAATDAVTPTAEGTDPAALAVALNQLLNGEQATPTVSTAAATPAATTPGTQPASATTVPPAIASAPVAPAPVATTPATTAAETAPVLTTAPASTTTAAPTAPQADATTTTTTTAAAVVASTAPAADAAPEQPAPTTPAPAGPLADAAAPAPQPATQQQQSSGGDSGEQGAAQPRAQGAQPAQPLRQDAAAAATAPAAEQAPSPVATAAAKPGEQAPAHAAPQAAQGQSGPAGVGTHPLGHAHSASAANAAAATAPAARPVMLDQAVETVRLAMRASAERGVTHARISLSPAELGGIEIHLRHTADGLVAKVIADSAGAAQILQQSANDLRRELEQQGLNLLQLDIGASGEQAGEAGAQQGFGDYEGGTARRDAAPADELLTVATDAPPTARSLQLPNGALVDVLA